MLIILIICTQIIYVAAEVYNEPMHRTSHVKPQHLWHSYTFNSGTGNREELQFAKVGLDKNFASAHGVFLWRSLKVDEQVVVVGLGSNFLLITNINKNNDSHSYKEELQNPPKSVCLFEKWDVKTQGIKHFAVVAVEIDKNIFALKWYQVTDGKLEFLWDWPFHRIVTYIDVVKLNHESKLLVVSYQNVTNKNPSADIYSFNINSLLDIWLFEKIILDDVPSSVSIFDNNENTFLCATFPSLETIHIFKYSRSLCFQNSEQKHFTSHQKIYSIGLKSAISFRVGFQWYLAVASKHSTLYYIKEDYLFYPIDNIDLGSQNYWLAIPIETYREDIMLLSDSSSDISIISWREEKPQVFGSFVQLVCGEDIECLEKMNRVSLKKSTAFYFNGQQNVILSTEHGHPLLFKLTVNLKILPDKVMLTLNDLLKTKTFIQEKYDSQHEQIENLDKMIKDSSEEDDSDETSDDFVFTKEKPKDEIDSQSHTKNWTDVMNTINELKNIIDTLSLDIKNLKDNVTSSIDQEKLSSSFLSKNVTEGITFYGKVLINDLNLSTVNGYDVNDLLRDSFRKDKKVKIKGKKNLRNLNVNNLFFEKIGGTSSSDLVFSDTLCQEAGQNIINGDITWENALHVLNDFQLSSIKKWNVTSDKITSRPYRYFEDLNFEELEITNSTYIKGSVNRQPFILPVHSGHLNIHYLDVVNQAQIDVVNVEENLKIDFINGKNFTKLFHQMILKNNPPNETINFLRIDGALSTFDLEMSRLNFVDLKESLDTEKETNSKPMKRENIDNDNTGKFKRRIHVYQNLEVDGRLFAGKVNNVTWNTIQDTVRKNEDNIHITGMKTFTEPLEATKMNISGTFNGKNVETVLTTTTDQKIQFYQNFDKVEFKNLRLNGSWDGIPFESLNHSLVRLSLSKSYTSNLTFEGDCLLFCEGLNVTHSINDYSVKEEDIEMTENESYGGLKSIVASRVVLHGSLNTNDQINNISLRNFADRRVTLKSPQVVEQDFVRQNLTLRGNINIITLNNNDISSILNSGGDTKLIDKFLNGKIQKVKKLLVKGNVTTRNGVNKFNLRQIFEKGINIKEHNDFKGNITFENLIYFDNVNVTDSIDGFSLKQLEKDIVFKHNHVFLNGVKNFSTIKVVKDVRVRALNGHLMQDIVTLKGDQSMKGPLVINGSVIVRGNVTLFGGINEMSVSDLLKKFSTNGNAYIVPGNLKLKSDTITIDNLVVNGKIQNTSFEDFVSDTISKTEDFSAKGIKSFNGELKLKQNAFVNGTMNGINFEKLLSDIVYINKPQKFEGKLVIQELVLKELEISDSFNSKLINNLDVRSWFEDSIPLDKYEIVTGKKTFENIEAKDDIKVDFINGHLPSATIRLKEKQHIPVLALFPKIQVLSDLSVSGFVNGRNLKKEFEDSVLLFGDQTINSKTTFSKSFTINGSLTVDTIKGKKVNNLITLNTEQNISTPLEIQGSVIARKGVEDLSFINNINLKEWNENSVLLNKQQVINGLWRVHGNVKTKNVGGDALVDTVDLPTISKDIRNNRNMAATKINETDFELNEQCMKLKKLSEEYIHLPYTLQQFDIASEYEFSTHIDSVINFKINNDNYMIISFINECLSRLYQWDKTSSKFIYLREINIGIVSKWSVTYRNNSTYLITSSLRSSVKCEENLMQGNVWVFEDSPDRYVHLLATNPFTDIILENSTSDVFYTLEDKGILTQWSIKHPGNISAVVVASIGHGHYKFIDFSITGGLAITNGREIRQIKMSDDDVVQLTLSFPNANLVPLPLKGKTLVALIVKDKIVVYENILKEKVFAVIHTYKAGSVLWFNYGPEKQAFLIISSHHKLIEVFEYKSVSGLVKKISIPMFSSRLQSVDLPSENKYQVTKFVIVIQKKKIIFLKTDMMGDYFEGSDSLC